MIDLLPEITLIEMDLCFISRLLLLICRYFIFLSHYIDIYIYRKRDISWYRKRFDPFSFLLLVILWIRARIRSFLEALYIKIVFRPPLTRIYISTIYFFAES